MLDTLVIKYNIKYFKKIYGKPENAVMELVQCGYLPPSFRSYRQKYHAAFDIETLEKKNERQNEDLVLGTFEEAVLRPVSIGCSNNINGEDRFFLRKSSHPDDAPALVHEFLDYCFTLVDLLFAALPNALRQATEKIISELETEKFSKYKTEKQSMLKTLKDYRTLAIYGFNSGKNSKFNFNPREHLDSNYYINFVSFNLILGKFDLPCLITYIATYCEQNEVQINIIKKGAGYMTVDLVKDGKRMTFRDVRNYCPPCSLDKFLTSWEAPFSKSIFPYQRYGSVEELAAATEFPTKEDFFNSLKQVNI